MKKNAFTLLELLGVVIILGVLSLITFPIILNQIKNAKQGIKDSTKTLIIDAAKDYYEDNTNNYEKIEGMTYCIDIKTLTDENYLNKNLKNENLNNIDTNKKVKLIFHNNKFDYEIVDSCTHYTVTFDANGGSVDIESKEVIENSTYGTLPTPTRAGYTFMGWNGKNIIDKSQSSFEEIQNETPFSHWAYPPAFSTEWVVNNLKPDTQYSISYDIEGISVPEYDEKYSSNLGFYLYSFNSDKTLYPNRVIYESKYIDEGELFHSIKSFITPSNVNLSDSKYTFYIYTNRYEKDGTGVFSTIRLYNLQLEEGDTATEYEPYFVTSKTKVTRNFNHTLKAIWKENE